MPWVQARVQGHVTEDGRVEVALSDLTLKEGKKPSSFEEAGTNPEMSRRINERIPGPIDTLGFIGGAVAWLLPFDQLALLDEWLMAKLEQKYGPWEHAQTYLMQVRNTGAPGIWNCAEPTGGMPENQELIEEQLLESLELGLYRKGYRGEFTFTRVPGDIMDRIYGEQHRLWELVRPSLKKVDMILVDLPKRGRDLWNRKPGVIACGPVGDITFVRYAFPRLTGSGWRVCDLETRPGNRAAGEAAEVPLRRQCHILVKREQGAPLVLPFTKDGGLDDFGLPFILDGENVQHAISHLSRAVLRDLGWLTI
ncbi:MAG: hypothetical protein HYZ09_04330 [Candidatus Kerfeldbacteria bacterium]|nr:hypothetical protein [Candidatus Kerfeldbacteria bacterium]